MKYSLSEVATMFELPISTLRYYEKHNLLPFLSRAENGYYYIEESDITQLHLICFLKAAGFSIKEISENASLAEESKRINEHCSMIYEQISLNMSKHLDDLIALQQDIVGQMQVTSYIKWLFDQYAKAGTSVLSSDKLNDEYPGHLPPSFKIDLPSAVDIDRLVESFKTKHPNYPIAREE